LHRLTDAAPVEEWVVHDFGSVQLRRNAAHPMLVLELGTVAGVFVAVGLDEKPITLGDEKLRANFAEKVFYEMVGTIQKEGGAPNARRIRRHLVEWLVVKQGLAALFLICSVGSVGTGPRPPAAPPASGPQLAAAGAEGEEGRQTSRVRFNVAYAQNVGRETTVERRRI
jgi:hypothetical protein